MYQELLEDVKKDHLSGASELSRKAAKVLEHFCREASSLLVAQFSQQFTNLARELVTAQREITPILNLANQSLNTLHQHSTEKETKKLAGLLSRQIEEFQKSSLKALEIIWREGAELLPPQATILTCSSSGSVLGILKQAHLRGKGLEIFICESRPLLEGRRLARLLAEEGLKVNLITDAAASFFMPETDLVLVGADSVSEHDFVNKIGTYALTLLAREFKKGVWLAVEENKFISQEARAIPSLGGNPAEIWQQAPPGVKCYNPYFEAVPLALVEKILTNQGLLTPPEVSNFIRQFPLAPELLNL